MDLPCASDGVHAPGNRVRAAGARRAVSQDPAEPSEAREPAEADVGGEPRATASARGRWRRGCLLVVGVVLAGLGAAALGAWWWVRVPPTDSSTADAIAMYTRVLNGEREQQEPALSALAGAIARDPSDARAQLWFGLANLNGFVETRELPYAIRTSRALERAVELDPGDASAEGWRAFFAYQAARSRDRDLEAARRALLDASAADPRFTPFLAAVALAPMPLESGYPARVLPPLVAIEDCGDGTSWSCRTGPLFPHGAEGYHTTVGDLRVRLGDLEGGRASYARALEMPAADAWPYRAAFERWVGGADERAALLTNDEPSDDPTVFFASGERACASCHRRAPP